MCYYTSGVACPYFYPVRPRASEIRPDTAMWPLGDHWEGLCRAVPGERGSEGAMELPCNFGYARGVCERFPPGDGPDAVRFAVKRAGAESIGLYYVVERDHHPFAHGPLEYSVAGRCLVNPPAGETLGGQALAYADRYLRRIGPDRPA